MRDETADPYTRVYNRVDEILYYVWDPIGVSGATAARDEYDSYVPTIVKMLFDGADAGAIAEYLRKIESESMGLSLVDPSGKRRQRTVELLIEITAGLTDKQIHPDLTSLF